MSRAPFQLSPLDAAHDRSVFRNDSEPLNHYLQEQVTQDIRRRVAEREGEYDILLAYGEFQAQRSHIFVFERVFLDISGEVA